MSMFKKRPSEEAKNTTPIGSIPPKPTTPPLSSSPTPTPANSTNSGPKMTTTPQGPTAFTPAQAAPRSGQQAAHHHTTPSPQHNPSRTLVVGSGISVQGTILDAECLIVEGIVEAEHLNAQELIVSKGGTLRGKIDVENAELSGTVDGSLTVRNCLTVQSTGRLVGKAECRRLQVEDGGQIMGELNVITTPLSHTSDQQQAAE